MPLPQYPSVIFSQTPLRLVICQVRFPVLLRFSDGAFVAPFHEAIAEEYPTPDREQVLGWEISPEKGVQTSPPTTVWRFNSADQAWSAVLGEAALTLEVRGYRAIDDFAPRFERLVVAARHHLGVRQRLRLGLRYINEFRRTDAETVADWAALFRPEFIGFVGTDLIEGNATQSAVQAQFETPQGTLNIRHGLFTGAAVQPLPENAGKFYLLDMDYFDSRAAPLEAAGTTQRLRAYNNVMYRYFRWAIGDGALYESLEPQNA
jgi:uncharacterized protein (TIGR04255 family)